MDFFGVAHGFVVVVKKGGVQGVGGVEQKSHLSLHKHCHTHPKMMKHSRVKPCLKKVQKIYESRDTPFEFC